MNRDSQPDLHLVGEGASDDVNGGDDNGVDLLSGPATDLVADLVGDTGLLPAEKVDELRERAALGGSFSAALLDEGLASSLGIARSLAERYHLPLVDLAVEGVDANATSMIPLPVLERVCAIPFAIENGALKIAITDPQNVRAL